MVAAPILFVDHAPALGGAEHSLLMLLRHLNRERFTPHLACPPGGLSEAAQSDGIPIYQLDLPRLRRSLRVPFVWLNAAREIAAYAREIQARAVVSNTVRATFYTAPAAKRILCALASAVIANSHATAANLPCRAKTTVIHNGIEIARFDLTLDGVPFRREHNIPASDLVVGTMGRLRPWKGQDRLVRVMARVREHVPGVHTVIIGGSPFGEVDDYVSSLYRLVQALALSVTFTGQLSDPLPALAAIDIFVHPGDPEPFGLVNVEAMALGKPVIAFAHGALPEIVDEGKTGILVAPGDERALSQAIIALLGAPDLRERFGQAGYERARQYFSVQRTVRELEDTLGKTILKDSTPC
jgi:glycosyltransferase involved in cell wall biosynthesis